MEDTGTMNKQELREKAEEIRKNGGWVKTFLKLWSCGEVIKIILVVQCLALGIIWAIKDNQHDREVFVYQQDVAFAKMWVFVEEKAEGRILSPFSEDYFIKKIAEDVKDFIHSWNLDQQNSWLGDIESKGPGYYNDERLQIPKEVGDVFFQGEYNSGKVWHLRDELKEEIAFYTYHGVPRARALQIPELAPKNMASAAAWKWVGIFLGVDFLAGLLYLVHRVTQQRMRECRPLTLGERLGFIEQELTSLGNDVTKDPRVNALLSRVANLKTKTPVLNEGTLQRLQALEEEILEMEASQESHEAASS